MRKIILQVAMSLDGLIEGPNGEYDWCFVDENEDYGMSNFLKRIDSIFVGRKTYEMSLGMEGETGFSHIKQYVFSTTLDKVKNGDVLIKGNVEEEVKKIKAQPGKDIWLFGGASLTSSLLEKDLVDEMELAVHPIVLGSGKPLFSNLKGRINLKLIDAITYSSGLVMMKYRLTNE
jgi:dihydrofolate reductase